MLQKLRSPLGYLLTGSLLLAGGLAVLFILAIRSDGDPYIAEVPLTDGLHRLRLYQVVEGPLHYEWKPSSIERFLPMRLSPHIPPITVDLDGIDRWHREPGFTFLFRAVDARGRYADPSSQMLEFAFVESTGFVFQESIGTADYPHWGTNALTRCALPRRDRELVIRISDRMKQADQPVEMTVPNPSYKASFPAWQAEPLPIERTNGPLTIRLEKMRLGKTYVYPEFTVTSSAPEWQSPTFQTVLEDATGNVGRILSPFEPVWKLKTNAYPSNTAEFPASLRAVLEKIPVLGPRTVNRLERKFQIDGIDCQVVYVAGSGIVRESGGQLTARPISKPDETQGLSAGSTNGVDFMEVGRKSPFVLIELLKPLPQNTWIVGQTTIDGKRVECPLGSMLVGNRTGSHTFVAVEIPSNPGAPEVDLTIALNRPELFEFFVAPPEEAKGMFLESVTASQ